MIIFFITTFLIIWFNTEAFVEYIHLTKLPIFKINEYISAKSTDCSLTYHIFLLSKYDCFFVRLITCPICTCMWICIFLTVTTFISILQMPMLFILSLLLYFIFNKIST